VTFVSGADRVAEVKRRDADQQIRERNDSASFPSFRVDLCGKLSHLFRKRLERYRRVDRFQIVAAALDLFRSFGAMKPRVLVRRH